MSLTPLSSHGGGGAPVGGPFVIPDTGTQPIVKDESGDTLFSADADTGLFEFLGTVDAAAGLGPSIQYVQSQAGPPDSTYSTPLVYDSTAVTGGLYAWDSSQYVKVGNLVT